MIPAGLRRSAWLAAILMVAACAAPAQQQVGEPDGGIFFEVPADWTEVAAADLEAAQANWRQEGASAAADSAIIWQSAWSADELVTPADVFANEVPQRLITYAQSRTLYPEERSALKANPNAIADAVLAVGLVEPGDGLEVRQNRISNRSGWLVLEQELAWDTGGVTQTMKVRAMVDAGMTQLRLFWIRCSDTCFFDEAEIAERVLKSLVVRS